MDKNIFRRNFLRRKILYWGSESWMDALCSNLLELNIPSDMIIEFQWRQRQIYMHYTQARSIGRGGGQRGHSFAQPLIWYHVKRSSPPLTFKNDATCLIHEYFCYLTSSLTIFFLFMNQVKSLFVPSVSPVLYCTLRNNIQTIKIHYCIYIDFVSV